MIEKNIQYKREKMATISIPNSQQHNYSRHTCLLYYEIYTRDTRVFFSLSDTAISQGNDPSILTWLGPNSSLGTLLLIVYGFLVNFVSINREDYNKVPPFSFCNDS